MVLDSCARDVDKVFNTLTVIVSYSLSNWIFTLQFRYIGKDVNQRFPGLLVRQRIFLQLVIELKQLNLSVPGNF